MATLQGLACQLQGHAASFPRDGIARDLVSAAQAGIRNVAGGVGSQGVYFGTGIVVVWSHGRVVLVIPLCDMYDEYQLRQPGAAGTIT